VALCRRYGIPVGVVPGPTAVTTALALAGLPTGRFTFEGFLSVNKKPRREHLDSLRGEQRTMVFYEAPHKLVATLSDLLAVLGEREIALVRELTKVHEEVVSTTLSAAVETYTANAPRGEFVIIVRGADAPETVEADPDTALALARGYVAEGLPPSEAAKKAAAATGLKKGDVYKALISDK